MPQLDPLIVVFRPTGGKRDFFRKYRIEVDGTPQGALPRGGRIEIPVPAGRHSVQARIDWTGSPSVEVEVPAGRQVLLEVRPTGGPTEALAKIGRVDTYLALNVVSGDTSS